MDILNDRLETFQNWQYKPSPLKLAEAGFYSTGYHDIVMCFSCRTSLRYFKEDDDPMLIHEEVSKMCPFLTNVSKSRNNPLTDCFPIIKLQTSVSPCASAPVTSDMSISELEEDNRRRRAMLECRVCRERPSCMLLIPCGHRAICGECAPNTSTCPDCEREVTKTVKTYIA
ncbi:BIR7B-like protein [Mya arenaria]|uniref:BIR7B-like protein n=1 Tax=Mya arenaria TaxID=6604 RepID=A0ABY7EJP1_MYAAR|nr:BIR7B-like protein [Mya arenaria]